MSSVVIERHLKIQADANPYDPKYEQYFEKRLHVKMTKGQIGKTKLARLWVQQKGICPACKTRIDDVENINLTVRAFRRPVHQIVPQCLDKGWTGIQATLKYAPVRHLKASYSSNPFH